MLDIMSKTQQLVYIICFENNPSSTNLTLGWGQVCAGLPRENWQASYIIKLIRVQSVAETSVTQSNINIPCNFNTENWLLEFLQCSGNTLELNKNFISKHCNDSLQQILSPSFWEMISFFCQQDNYLIFLAGDSRHGVGQFGLEEGGCGHVYRWLHYFL